MNMYKRYMYELRDLALKDPYIILQDDIVPKLKHYILMLHNIKFEDGTYHAYYGEIKTIVNSFNIHWTEVMDEAIKEADRCSKCMTSDELLNMADRTIFMHQVKQTDFEGQFLPLNNPLEEKLFNETLEKYKDFMERLEKMKGGLKRLDKQEKVDAFAKEHFVMSLKRKNDIFVFTYNYISSHLSSVVGRIRVSIEEIFNRLRNNLRSIQEKSDLNVSNLLLQLYEKNKEHLSLARQDVRSSIELAEISKTAQIFGALTHFKQFPAPNITDCIKILSSCLIYRYSMDIIRDKIGDSKHVPTQRLQDECKYWQDRIQELDQIEGSLQKLQEEENRVLEQEKLFNAMKDTAIPAPKRKCWENMNERIKAKLDEIHELKMNAAKALHTFFCVRGPDRIFYSDNIGTYFVDDYGHQCYVFDYGLSVYHLNCDGDFVELQEKDEYLYDSMGRFYVDKNTKQKLYQIGPCSSTYKMEKDLFAKRTKDCGHSENANKECRMLIKDPTDVVLLPKIAPQKIKDTLDPEVVNYLWDSFGHILPDVLYDVADTRPRNPIHNLAHKLLVHKYKRTEEESKLKKEEADVYRKKIYQERIKKADATYKAWKGKQTRPRKSDEIDDAEETFAYNDYLAKQDFVRSLQNQYN